MYLARLPHLLTLIAGTACAALAADKPRLATLAQLDLPPERLEARPVTVPAALQESGTDDTVSLIAIVGTNGRVERVDPVESRTPAGTAAAVEAVMSWVFTRAYAKGEAVSFSLPVTVAIRPGQVTDLTDGSGTDGAEVVEAESRFEWIPEYPAALRASPVDGYAVANALIDEEGKVSDVVVEFASRDEFVAPAAAVLPTWIFTPARRGDQNVATRKTVRIQFDAKSATWTAAERDHQSHQRYLRDYDVSPREKTSKPMVLPYDALMAEKGGSVTFTVVVAPDGSVARLVPEGKPDPDYVGAARASLGCWEFFPATRAGQPVFGQVKMQINFEPRSKEFEFDATTFAILAGLRNSTAKIYSLKQIDELPKPTKQVQSCFPRDHEGPTSGEAVIECIIDTQGRPQLPRVIRASTPDFGWIAATTVAQWRFEPARKEGEAVASRVRIPIRIAAEPPAPSAAR